MRIRDLASAPPTPRRRRAGKWSTVDDGGYRTLFHYSTAMLTWPLDRPRDVVVRSVGHGSVSDQQGVNQVLRALDGPFYYSRKGGAEILDRHEGGAS